VTMRAVKRPEVGARPLAAMRLGVPPPASGGEAGNQPRGSVPPMSSAEHIAETVNRYISLIAKGTADDLVELYADDATVEDPVGGEVHIGRQAIHGFYSAVENVQRECELVTLRVAGNEAAFHFKLTVSAGDSRMVIEPIDVMVFDADGKVAAMKAYWSPENARQL
jgi:steroid Delta-isomerase